jgi:hypothetical protein
MPNRRHWLVVMLLGALASLPVTFAAQPPAEGESVYAAARAAIAKGQVERSKQVGHVNPNRTFVDTPFDGAVLIGFELGLGKSGKEDVIYAFRALYASEAGATQSHDFGQFVDRTLPNGKIQKSRVTRTVRVEADPGYAVAGISLRMRGTICGMQVTFQRLKGQKLDPTQSYTSDWIGDVSKNNDHSIIGKGSPAIGVFGSEDDQRVLGLGLVWFKQAEAAKPPVVAAKPLPEQPKPAQEQPKPPPDQPKPPTVVAKPPAEQPPATPPEKAVIQPRNEPKPAVVEPEPQPAEPEPQVEQAERPPAPVGQAPPPAPYGSSPGGEMLQMVPFMILPLVVIAALVGARLLVANQSRQITWAYRQLPPEVIPVVKPASTSSPSTSPAPSTSPPPLPTADAQTAICVQPSGIKPPPLPRQQASDQQRWAVAARVPDQPPFFTARLLNGMSKRLCRVFLLPKEMLLLNAGMENPDQTTVAFVAFGGLIGGLIGHFLTQGQRKNAEARQRLLDDAETRDLVRLASRERDALWIPMTEVASAAAEPQSFWRSLFTANCVALLHLESPSGIRTTLELPTATEARMAMDYLAPLLGERLVTRLVWDKKKQRFVGSSSSLGGAAFSSQGREPLDRSAKVQIAAPEGPQASSPSNAVPPLLPGSQNENPSPPEAIPLATECPPSADITSPH